MHLELAREISLIVLQFSSVAQLCPTLQPCGLQHARLSCPSPTPGACSNPCPSSWWCPPIISFSVVPFSSCLQSFLASGSFPVSQFFASGGQSLWAILTPFWFSSYISTFCSRSFWQKHWWLTACLLVISTDFFGAGKTSSQKNHILWRWKRDGHAGDMLLKSLWPHLRSLSRKWVLGSTDYRRNSWIFIRRNLIRSKSVTSISQRSLFLWRLS